ncbi:ESCRT-II complex subunit-domain-containing protein [Hypoxylon argillaceum]|nr:ESCRT-II complex subunit-domain-containing protein [Hypoxylon argillaceum]
MATPAPSHTTTSSSTLGAIGHLTPTTTTTTTTPSASSPGTFEFPREYHYPPFFTRQPNQSTRHSQQSKWASLVLAYCAHHRLYKLSLASPSTADLFYNRRLDRRLSLADAREVLEFMRRDGRAEFVRAGAGAGGSSGDDSEGDVAWIYWRTPEEWATLLEAWIDETAQKGAVLTLYELSQGEDTTGTEFHGLDLELLQKALQVLVKRNKAQIFGQEDQLGVKFF